MLPACLEDQSCMCHCFPHTISDPSHHDAATHSPSYKKQELDYPSLDDRSKTEHLLELDGAKDRLKFFEANLLEQGSFDAAIDGCIGVFHSASPVKIAAPNPQKWYLMSKTLAEQAAWKFVKEKEIDMVTINPTVCIGPLLQNTLSGSCTYIHALVNGSETYLNETFNWVHVKDVAEAHIRTFEIPSAHGRYLMGESIAHHSEVVEILRELYPHLKLPTKPSDDRPPAQLCKISQELNILRCGMLLRTLLIALRRRSSLLIKNMN